MVFANSVIEHVDGSDIVTFRKPTSDGIVESLLLPMTSIRNNNYLARSVWHSIYKLDFIRKNGIRFLNRNTYFEEDTLFNLEVYTQTSEIRYLDKVVYHWVKYDESTSEKYDTHDIEIEKILNFLQKEWEILKQYTQGEYKEYYYVMVSYFLRRYYSIIKQKDSKYLQRLAQLLIKSGFPVLGRYENLKWLSKIRIKLFFFIVKLKMQKYA